MNTILLNRAPDSPLLEPALKLSRRRRRPSFFAPARFFLRLVLSRVPPSVLCYIYTVLLKPLPLRRIVQKVIKQFVPATIEFRGSQIVLNQNDAIVSGSLALCSYETFVTDVLETLLCPGMTFFDIGANIGIYTALAARCVGPSGRVIAVEPEPANIAIIRKTIRLNVFENVTVIPCAAGDRIGKALLYISEQNPADHRLHDPKGRRSKIAVATMTLDAVRAEFGVETADLIKVDTQGWEAAVFAGMTELLTQSPKPIFVVEFWPWGLAQAGSNPRELLELFVASGLSIFEIDSDQRKIVPTANLDQLADLRLERQHTNLLLCEDAAMVDALRIKLACLRR